ncbi:hypothetical protein [Chromobacterium amazonense]|uniref:hypothetical protein n=1 Tax=Chromobacterium amazonense TaxID=1382803 RepID=UPI003F7B0E70
MNLTPLFGAQNGLGRLRAISTSPKLADTNAPRADTPPLLDSKGVQVGSPESRFGMSRQSLQLLKAYDVRNISGRDLYDLVDVLAANHDIDPQLAADIRGNIDSNGWKTGMERNALQMYDDARDAVVAAVKSGKQLPRFADSSLRYQEKLLSLFKQLAGLHDALQKDARVETAAEGGARQAANLMRLDRWMASADRNQQQGLPLPPASKDTYFSITETMDALGIDVNPSHEDLTPSATLERARDGYRKWREQHPGETLAIELQTDKPDDAPAPAADAQPAAPLPQEDIQARAQDARQEKANLMAQAQYGMPIAMLQLIKSVDFNKVSAPQLKQYAGLLRDYGVISQDDADALTPFIRSGEGSPARYFHDDLADASQQVRESIESRDPELNNPQALARQMNRSANDKQALALITRLSQLHQQLQMDDRVQAISGDGLRQAEDLAAFQRWTQVEQKPVNRPDDAVPEFSSKDQAEGILRVLQRMGVALTPQQGNPGPSARLESAWKDYQAWRKQNPAAQPAMPLTPSARLDAYA